MVPNGAKKGQTGSNGAKKGQKGLTEPNGAKRANGAKRGHMGLIFCMHAYFYEIKKSCLATQALRKNWPSYGDFVDSKILMGLH